MTAEELMRQGGRYAQLGMKAETKKDWLYWRDRLSLAIHVSREEFGPDAWVTKDLEGMLHDVNTRPLPGNGDRQ
jgi:hypothetical protein